ncbi:MAG: efflux RND transporter periplasmic adaptor subunit [Verrucomicrobia bacterium]|nr:efflux RND transporter periplasmic adaptor subunit [Verrucomicrobiota bacterium]
MFRKYIIPLLALVGVGIGIFAAIRSAKTITPAAPVSDAPQPPYPAFVAGAGLVEASTENIAIGTQIPGIVSKIHVQIGCNVTEGNPLFTIDDRAQRALVASRQAAVQVVEAQLADLNYELKLADTLAAAKITSLEERDRDRFAVQKAEAQLAQARADLNSAETDLERLTVRAPVDGQVLQLKVRRGEFAATGVLDQPLILLGNVSPLHLRVDVDENDAWRVRAQARAIGFLRGNKDIHTPLTFVRFEPYVVPKKSLTGQSTERVDTRVLQVIFSFERGALPIFVGQQMDVFIDASEAAPR